MKHFSLNLNKTIETEFPLYNNNYYYYRNKDAKKNHQAKKKTTQY